MFVQVCAAAIFAVVNARPGGGYEHFELAGIEGGEGHYGGGEGHYGGEEEATSYQGGGLESYGGNEIGHGDGGHQEEYVDYHVRKNLHYYNCFSRFAIEKILFRILSNN